jgi:acetyl-CoA synthetase (ADP-forming)
VPPATTTLSEAASKELLSGHGIPFPSERVVRTAADAAAAATEIGFPVVVKLNGDRIAHKTERGLVRLGLRSAEAVEQAAAELLAKATPEDGEVTVLVAEMVSGSRELIAGLVDDPLFGKVVMLGLGGILAEAVADVSFRLVPLTKLDAEELIADLSTQKLLDAFRGEPAVDREALAGVLLALSDVATRRPEVKSVDLNPVLLNGARPVAVDALVEVTS